MKFLHPSVAVFALVVFLSACQRDKGPFEEAGSDIDRAVEQAEEASRDAMDEASKAMQDATDAAEDAWADMGEAMDDMMYDPPAFDEEYHSDEQ